MQRLICPIMDARRNQVYTGIYRFEEKFETVKEQLAEDITVLAGMLNELGERVVFLGDGVPVYREKIEETVKVPYVLHRLICAGRVRRSRRAWTGLCERGKDRACAGSQTGLSQDVPGGRGRGWNEKRNNNMIARKANEEDAARIAEIERAVFLMRGVKMQSGRRCARKRTESHTCRG